MIANKYEKLNIFRYLGGIHIHSMFSDGTGDINSISKAAKRAGLDFIIVTDHNSLEIEEGFFNGVCVIKGEEISSDNKNHYLALGINECIQSDNPKEFIEEVKKQGGFGFAAHPDEGENKKGLNRKNPYLAIKWTDKNITPDGIEIWNWFSQWADNLDDGNIFSLIYCYLFKHNLITEPNKNTMKWWDELNNNTEKIIPSLGGTDCHELILKDYIIPIKIFPYEKMFKTITNVLTFEKPLSEDFAERKDQILNAIKEGNNLIINRKIDKNIPEINLTGGSKVKLSENLYLNIETKKKTLIQIIHNGKELYRKIAKKCNLKLKEKGKYRVEIKVKNKGFAYTNPILVY